MPPRFEDRPTIIKAKRELLEQAARNFVDAGYHEGVAELAQAARAFVKAERASYGRRRVEVA